MKANSQPIFHLFGATLRDLQQFVTAQGFKQAHAATLFKAVHKTGLTDFSKINDLPLALRELLLTTTVCNPPQIIHQNVAPDGVHKWLISLTDGNVIETVFIPERSRGTLCVSSQVGCALNCDFCATGKQGFNRNLSTAEIIAQMWVASRHYHVTNMVFMGMGEPLLNLDNVLPALDILLDDNGYNLSKHTVTISTAGLVPQLQQLAATTDVSLAVSLHAPNDILRTQLMPINKKYPITELINACKHYFTHPKRKILFEYILIDGINDTEQLAYELADLLQGVPAKINLIPFNPIPNSPYDRSKPEQIALFQNILRDRGINTFVRKTRGPTIDAACGQLKGDFVDRTRRRA